MIEQEVAEERAASPASFHEEAVKRLLDAARSEDTDSLAVIEAEAADISAGRYVIADTDRDRIRLHDRIMEKQRARLGSRPA